MIPISEPTQQTPPAGFALFALGFRPFYLLAALFSAVSVLVWLAVLRGQVWHGFLSPLAWHQHEMTFGFALGGRRGLSADCGPPVDRTAHARGRRAFGAGRTLAGGARADVYRALRSRRDWSMAASPSCLRRSWRASSSPRATGAMHSLSCSWSPWVSPMSDFILSTRACSMGPRIWRCGRRSSSCCFSSS